MKKTFTVATLLVMCAAMPAFANDMAGNHEAMMDKHFKEADTNNDGVISMAEHEICAKKMFNKADANGDGRITRQEMTDAWKMHKGENYGNGGGYGEAEDPNYNSKTNTHDHKQDDKEGAKKDDADKAMSH